MADLIRDAEMIASEIGEYGNFMLQLDNRTWPKSVLVDQLIRPLVSVAERVEMPGYIEDWAQGANSPPQWALALSSVASRDGLSIDDALSAEIRGFWMEGSFTQKSEHLEPPKVFRPAIPLLCICPERLHEVPLRTFATTFVGFSTSLRSKEGLLGKAYQRAVTKAASEDRRAMLPYQGTEWLHFVGSRKALNDCASVLRAILK